MSKKDKMTMRKVSLISLIDLLKQIYDDGADYIDIEGEQTDGEEDMLKITVRPEYFKEFASLLDDYQSQLDAVEVFDENFDVDKIIEDSMDLTIDGPDELY